MRGASRSRPLGNQNIMLDRHVSSTLQVEIGGVTHTLYFNLNTFDAFEKASGQFFLDFLMEMRDAVVSVGGSDDEAKTPTKMDEKAALQLIRKISVRKIRALLWAALHTYDVKDEPEWPYTIGKLSKMVDISNMGELLPKLWAGANANMPEVTEEQKKENPPQGAAPPQVNGGGQFGPSDADVLASLQQKSGD